MKDNLIICNNIKKLIIYLDKIIKNFPNNEKVIKDKILSTLFEILELVYFTNELNYKDRVIYQKKIISKIKVIDFYFKLCFEKNIFLIKNISK